MSEVFISPRARRFTVEVAARAIAASRGMGAEAKPGSIGGDFFDFDLSSASTATSTSSATGGSATTNINLGGGSSTPSPTSAIIAGVLGVLGLGGLAMWGLSR